MKKGKIQAMKSAIGTARLPLLSCRSAATKTRDGAVSSRLPETRGRYLGSTFAPVIRHRAADAQLHPRQLQSHPRQLQSHPRQLQSHPRQLQSHPRPPWLRPSYLTRRHCHRPRYGGRISQNPGATICEGHSRQSWLTSGVPVLNATGRLQAKAKLAVEAAKGGEERLAGIAEGRATQVTVESLLPKTGSRKRSP